MGMGSPAILIDQKTSAKMIMLQSWLKLSTNWAERSVSNNREFKIRYVAVPVPVVNISVTRLRFSDGVMKK